MIGWSPHALIRPLFHPSITPLAILRADLHRLVSLIKILLSAVNVCKMEPVSVSLYSAKKHAVLGDSINKSLDGEKCSSWVLSQFLLCVKLSTREETLASIMACYWVRSPWTPLGDRLRQEDVTSPGANATRLLQLLDSIHHFCRKICWAAFSNLFI